jgi:hypothetical protein
VSIADVETSCRKGFRTLLSHLVKYVSALHATSWRRRVRRQDLRAGRRGQTLGAHYVALA